MESMVWVICSQRLKLVESNQKKTRRGYIFSKYVHKSLFSLCHQKEPLSFMIKQSLIHKLINETLSFFKPGFFQKRFTSVTCDNISDDLSRYITGSRGSFRFSSHGPQLHLHAAFTTNLYVKDQTSVSSKLCLARY